MDNSICTTKYVPFYLRMRGEENSEETLLCSTDCYFDTEVQAQEYVEKKVFRGDETDMVILPVITRRK